MKQCILFCAGDFDGTIQPHDPDAYIIAVDGGFVHTQTVGLTPNAILGDFDSLGFVPEGAAVFPKKKDDTDTLLALRHGLALGCKEFYLYGAMGGSRPDHTMANYQALQFLCDRGAAGYLVGKDQVVTVVKNSTLRFPAGWEGFLSVFCLGSDATGVTLENFAYPMTDGVLSAGFPLGVSNHFTGKAAAVTVEKGSLLVFWQRKNGFPQRK